MDTVQVAHLMILGFGLAVGYRSGVIKERDRQHRIRRQIMAARLRRTS